MTGNTIGAAGFRVVRMLVGRAPQTVRELQTGAGVTRTAVTEQLRMLVDAGFVECTTERAPGRGRPRHLFTATPAALRLLAPPSQQEVVPAIWQAIQETGGDELSAAIAKRMSHALAAHYAAQITAKDPKERLRRLVNILRNEGGVLEMRHENGETVVYRRTCPFISMMDSHRLTCIMDLAMINEVVGCPVRRTACRMEGAPCCILKIDAP
jgi:DeoR family transcriptional regulator, suf operon transcriptional repressor